MLMRKIALYISCMLFGILLGGCATTGKDMQASEQVKLEDVLVEAHAAAKAGKNHKAIAILAEAAGAYPAEKAPWLKLAQLHFDQANYGDAVINALEVLQRAPDDQLATSIVAVSGLRLSTTALANLSRQNRLSGSLKTEAQDLAKLLRETLGEPVLVPVRSRATIPTPKPVVHVRRINRKAIAPAESGRNSDPFGALK